MKAISLDKMALLVDFDGTITKRDTNDLLAEKYLEASRRSTIRKRERQNFMKFFSSLIDEIKIREEEYLEFILSEVQLAEGFMEFYNNTKEHNIPLAVVSGGFENGIKPFLSKYGIDDIEILANKLVFNDDNLKIDFYHNMADCCDIGYCGNCKIIHYDRFKKDKEHVIFIGDGITDRAVANRADIVFAKDHLLEYCNAQNIHAIPWEDFDDINQMIF